ncbi:hypothetical protein D3C72_1519430 [compost metagenome]
MAEEFRHEGLAEAHHFGFALALGVEIGAALAAAHGQGGQRVLEGLFKRQELEHRQVDRGVKAQAALVGADGHAVLDAVAAVDLHLAMVVHPAHAKAHHALGLYQALQQAVFGVPWIFLDEGPQALHHFGDGLQELGLAGVALFDVGEKLLQGLVLHGQIFQGLGPECTVFVRLPEVCTAMVRHRTKTDIMPNPHALMHKVKSVLRNAYGNRGVK